MQPSGKSQVDLMPKPLPFLGYYGILQGHSKKGRPHFTAAATGNFGLDPLVFHRSYGSFPASMSSIVCVWTPGSISTGLALSACSTS